ncbi:hypothetical protein K440DRAFT_670083 [Wilcoxina mikolae CBS 423.85]|nr:hypothetical protein K440DRAFT_670083 [Wilcoxina mikolae CBS 423.85]
MSFDNITAMPVVVRDYNIDGPPISRFRANTRGPGYSPLECLMLIPPISTCVFSFLNTPDYLCVRSSSRTMRCFVENNRRFFRNLVFLKRGGCSEKLLDILESNADNAINALNDENQSLVVCSVVREILEAHEQLEWRKKELEGQMTDLLIRHMVTVSDEWRVPAVELWGHQSLKVKEQLTEFLKRPGLVKPEPFNVSDFYYPRLMGRHLSQIINNLPIGRNVTSIVLDGTGVDTEWIQLVMTRFASTLRGLSVRDCENIDGYIFPDWLLDCLYRHHPISLRWLRVWNTGNIPHFLNSGSLLEGIMPLTPHPDDAFAEPPTLVHQKSKLLANLMPKDFNISYVRRLLCPMFKYGQEKRLWLQDMENLLNGQYAEYEALHTENPESFPYWNAPLMPLGDINPVISLLALSRYMNIQLDFSLCAAQHFCWSYVVAGEPLSDLNQPAMFQVNIGSNTFQLPQHVDEDDDRNVLHTHSLAEIGARIAEGGQCCHVCGLWEGAPSPFEYCDGDEITDIGGIKTGNGIGEGRYSIGNLCIDCREMETCGECGKFVCHNCCFANPAAPQNPLMTFAPPEVQHLKFICDHHGAECEECVSTTPQNYFECDECGLGLCLRCGPPFGLQITTDLYGGEMDFQTMNDFDADLKLPYPKKSSFFRSRFCRLNAFKPRDLQDPGDMLGLLTLSEARQFEFCDGCDSAICIQCIARLQTHRPIFYRPNATLYTCCREGCGSVFCESCENNFASKCKSSCGVYVCDECDWNLAFFCVPNQLEKEWCRTSGCMDKSRTGKLDDLRGPWEDNWDGPSPFIARAGGGSQLNDPLVIMVNALKESGHLPNDLSVQDFASQCQGHGAEDGVLGALGRAAALLSSQSGASFGNILRQSEPYSTQLSGNLGGLSCSQTSGTVLEELDEFLDEDMEDYEDENSVEPVSIHMDT